MKSQTYEYPMIPFPLLVFSFYIPRKKWTPMYTKDLNMNVHTADLFTIAENFSNISNVPQQKN